MSPSDRLRLFDAEGCHIAVAGFSAAEEAVAALVDAMALASADPLLQVIDVWLDRTLDWSPIDPTTREPAEWMFSLAMRDDPGLVVHLNVDETVLHSLPPWPEKIPDRVNLRRHAWRLQVSLPAVVLSAEDQIRLASGSLLVMPGTFVDRLPVTLNPLASSGLPYLGYVDRSSAELHVNARPSVVAEPPTDVVCSACDQGSLAQAEISLTSPVEIPLSSWCAALREGAPVTSQLLVPSAAVLVTLGSDSWQGNLTNLGSGWAVLVGERVVTSEVMQPTAA